MPGTVPSSMIAAAMIVSQLIVPTFGAERISTAQQTSLVHKYCAVCHTDAVKNGGLSLQHYDAAQPDPALAAMLLSKLRNGAMGAAGLGIPDAATGDAWIAATAAQAERASSWSTIRAGTAITTSIVRGIESQKPAAHATVYRLTLTCDTDKHKGEIQLTWSPTPQVDRTFSVSPDNQPGIPHKLEGREEKMGNGAALKSSLASAMLNTPLPQKILTISDLFAGETVVFRLAELETKDREQLAVCFADRAAR